VPYPVVGNGMLVTATFKVVVEGDLLIGGEARLKELACDLMIQAEHDDGIEAFDWTIEEDD
jgi:hypothetical protein